MLSDAKMCSPSSAAPSPIVAGFADLFAEVSSLDSSIDRARTRLYSALTPAAPADASSRDQAVVSTIVCGGCCEINTQQLTLAAQVRTLRIRLDELIDRVAL